MKFGKTIGSVLLGIIMLGSVGAVSGCQGGWNGAVSDALSGAGTKEDPFRIESGGDLAFLRDKLNEDNASYKKATYSLGQDINLGDREWTPMQDFGGTFLGNGHKITHLKVSEAGNNSGLFASLSGAVVKDLTVSADIDCAAKSGILAGEATGNTVISNVTVDGSVTGNDKAQYVGGVVGYINSSGVTTISGAVNNADVSAVTYVGGIAGVNALCDAVYDSCVNNGKVSGRQNIGGIAGYSFARSKETAGKFVDCTNNGSVSGEKNLGGIVGTANLPLIRCTASPSASVTMDDGFETVAAGGMVGFADPYIGRLCGISNCDNTKSFSQLTDCTDEFGWAVTTTTASGCIRFVDYKDKVYLFGTTNQYAVSEDGGRSFGPFTQISNANTPTEAGPNEIDNPNGGHKLNDVGNTQPFVLKDGRIAIFYRAHYKGTFTGGSYYPYSSIRIRISDKNGNFNPQDEPIMLIETCSTTKNKKSGGLWEPFPVYLEDGTIAVYIASDTHTSEEMTAYGRTIPALDTSLLATGDSQNIIMVPLTIEDGATKVGEGITIGKTELMIQGSKTSENGLGDGETEADGVAAGNHTGNTDARPGMPIVTKLQDGSFAMIVESCEEQREFWDLESLPIPPSGNYDGNAFPMVIQLSYSRDGHTWTQPETIVRPALIGKKCAAPGIATLPDGRVIITYHTTMDYTGGTTTDSARMQQLTAAVSKQVLTYGAKLNVSYRYPVDKVSEDKNGAFIQLPLYRYSANESCVWGNVGVLKNGRVYIGGQHAINSVSASSVTSSLKWTLIMERDAGDLPTA